MPGDSLTITIGDTIIAVPPEMSGEPALATSNDYTDLFFIIGVVVVILVVTRFRTWQQEKLQKVRLSKLEGQEIQFRHWLETYNPYYRKLSYELKAVFQQRVLRFLATKNFHFVEMQEEERAKVLISAAAVQLTFGLQTYELEFFTEIYVLKSDYRYGLYNVPFEGHVSSDGIYLSWSHFERAYADYSDGSNVGLHEMAHALAYVNFVEMQGVDEGFRKRFFTFSKTGRPVFNSLKENPSPFLGDYAATNYNEFWAVCVEQFFERPETFRISHPGLFQALMDLLNQDPRIPGKILKAIENE